MSLATAFKKVNQSLNPFYRNVIVQMPDADLLRVDHLDPGAPHSAASQISQLLKANKNVHDAIECLQGDHYLLRSVLTYNELRVNVYEILPAPMRIEDIVTANSFLSGEPIKLLPFALTGHTHHVLTRLTEERWQLEGQVATSQTLKGYYEPQMPVASWIIPLEPADRRTIGIR